MTRVVDVRKAQEALDRAARSKNRAGRFTPRANMPTVDSSMMTSVDYDERNHELDITFISGKTYRYFEIPADIYAGLLDADSKGEFFNEHIKDQFNFNEVTRRRRR
jgi:KTSC domain